MPQAIEKTPGKKRVNSWKWSSPFQQTFNVIVTISKEYSYNGLIFSGTYLVKLKNGTIYHPNHNASRSKVGPEIFKAPSMAV